MSNEPKPEGRIPELNALIEKRVGKEILAKFGDGAAEDIAAAGAAARERVSNLLDPESWKNAPIYQSPLRDADGNEVFVTIFLDGRIKRIVPAGPQTLVPWVEPESDLPVDARERLKAMKDHDLRTLMEWFDGSPHFTDLLAYAKAVVTSRVPLERRITCSRCGALYGAWTKNDQQWDDCHELVDGWTEVEFRTGEMDHGEPVPDWKQLCPKCPPTPEELAEAAELRAETERVLAEFRERENR